MKTKFGFPHNRRGLQLYVFFKILDPPLLRDPFNPLREINLCVQALIDIPFLTTKTNTLPLCINMFMSNFQENKMPAHLSTAEIPRHFMQKTHSYIYMRLSNIVVDCEPYDCKQRQRKITPSHSEYQITL